MGDRIAEFRRNLTLHHPVEKLYFDELYFFSDGGAAMGRSELNMSTTHFQLPSACFFQTSRYLPLSVIGEPPASFSVNS